MKYNSIQPITLNKKHPMWPGQTFYKLYNTEKNKLSLGMYINEDAAIKQLTKSSVCGTQGMYVNENVALKQLSKSNPQSAECSGESQ